MAINTPRDLFLFEMAILRDAESTGKRLLEFLAIQTKQSDLAQTFRARQEDTQRHLANLNSCLQSLGYSPTETPSEPVEGIYRRFADFLRLQPAPDMLNQFAIDTAIRFLYVGIAGYKTLLDWAILMGESQCTRSLHANLVRKQESAGELEQLSHELGMRVLAPV